MAHALPRLGLRLLAGLSVMLGGFSLRYVLPRVPFAVQSANFHSHLTALVVHAASAACALALGPWQFLAGWRGRWPRLHRYVGRTYVAVVTVAALAALWIAPTAAAGPVSSVGFAALAVAWLVTTSLGVARVLEDDIPAHRRWMMRSFALTAAAITLRVYLALTSLLNWSFAST